MLHLSNVSFGFETFQRFVFNNILRHIDIHISFQISAIITIKSTTPWMEHNISGLSWGRMTAWWPLNVTNNGWCSEIIKISFISSRSPLIKWSAAEWLKSKNMPYGSPDMLRNTFHFWYHEEARNECYPSNSFNLGLTHTRPSCIYSAYITRTLP